MVLLTMLSRVRAGVRLLMTVPRGSYYGHCPICEKWTIFLKEGSWLRDQLRCYRCNSIPRWRALIHILQARFPDWRELRIHESSPGGASSEKIARECRYYTASTYFSDVPQGEKKDGIRCEDLQQQTFADASFDLVITSDVFEHVLDPAKAFAEVTRTLTPRGAHVFTVPWYWWKETLVRAVGKNDGSIENLQPPDYHGNPFDSNGSLVVTEWGSDLCDFIYRHSGATTTPILIRDMHLGIAGEFCEVFISFRGSGSGFLNETRERKIALLAND
jgi:SAM-dependent methyltransferase